MLLHELEVVLIDEGRAYGRADDANSNGNKHQARLGGRVPLSLLVDDGESHEEHVQQPVKDAHVQRNEEDDEFSEEQLKRPNKKDGQSLCHGSHIKILLGDVALVASRFAKFVSAAGENRGRVRLGDGKGDEDPDDGGEDELDPVQPAPAGGIGEEPTDERADWFFSLATTV